MERRRGQKEMGLVAWEKLCWPKSKGGLGLQDPKTTNDAYGKNFGGDG
jgi:hypothetical protein